MSVKIEIKVYDAINKKDAVEHIRQAIHQHTEGEMIKAIIERKRYFIIEFEENK